MGNQLSKFTPNLELTQPFCALLRKLSTWLWGSVQNKAFDSIKQELFKPMTLALYDSNAAT